MKKVKWTMHQAILLLVTGCTLFAIIAQTVAFEVISRQQIRRESLLSNDETLQRMEAELNSYKGDWQISSIEISSSNYSYDYSSKNGYLSDRESFGKERNYSNPVTKGSLKMTKYNPKGNGYVNIRVRNKKDGATLYFSINLAALNNK